MRKFNIILSAFLAEFLLIIFSGSNHVQARAVASWSPDKQVPGYRDETFTPFLVADQNRTVHAFASQWVGTGDRRHAVVYRQWSLNSGWTRPVDIILSPISNGRSDFLSALLDSTGNLHVIFMSGDTPNTAIYYSSAPAVLADSALVWSLPVMVAEGASGINSAAMVGDDQGTLVIIYSGNIDGNGVYSVSSSNAGITWTKPSPVFLTDDTTLLPFSLRMVMGPDRNARAVWNVVTNLGVDESLYFANYDMQAAEWGIPVELDTRIDLPDYFGPSFPALVDNGKEIVVVYNGGNPFAGRPVNPGRPIQRVRVSTNGGQTWNEPLDPFPFHVGRSGEHTLALDGNGAPHTLFIQRIESIDEEGDYNLIGGIWHSAFQNGVWTNPDRFVTTVPAHDVRSIVVQGNVLLAVWREDPGSGESGIWYSYSVLDIPELPVVPFSTIPAVTSGETDATAIPFSIAPTPLPDESIFDLAPPSNLGTNPALSIILGVIPVLLVLVVVLFGYQLFLKRRK